MNKYDIAETEAVRLLKEHAQKKCPDGIKIVTRTELDAGAMGSDHIIYEARSEKTNELLGVVRVQSLKSDYVLGRDASYYGYKEYKKINGYGTHYEITDLEKLKKFLVDALLNEFGFSHADLAELCFEEIEKQAKLKNS